MTAEERADLIALPLLVYSIPESNIKSFKEMVSMHIIAACEEAVKNEVKERLGLLEEIKCKEAYEKGQIDMRERAAKTIRHKLHFVPGTGIIPNSEIDMQLRLITDLENEIRALTASKANTAAGQEKGL